MPMRNRVTPTGDIVAIGLRGAWLGNRGILHEGRTVVRFHRSQLWIVCALEHRDWRLPQWQPNHFTVLFFHDEAVALAAGHRPCALCRRGSYEDYRRAWAAGLDTAVPLAKEMDRRCTASDSSAAPAVTSVGTATPASGRPVVSRNCSYSAW